MTTDVPNNSIINKTNTATISLVVVIFIWIIIQISFAIPDSIVADWMSWRQSDTQSIARNFMKSDSNIFYPQINWGGTGPGFVECEFQLYTFLIAQVMKISGESELTGQLLNLLFISLTAFVIFLALRLYSKNQIAAMVGAVFFLVSNGPVHLSTAIMPDALCILFYSSGLYFFLKFLDDRKNISLILFILFTTLAALIKPLALNLGIIQFFILVFGYRQLLKSPKIWAAWILIVVITLSYLLFSNGLFKEYGNTFGVLGGDSKFPTVKGLLVPIHYAKLFYMTILWGLGPIGFISLIYLVIKRKLTFIEWALIIGNIAAIFIPMRYTVNQGFSPHYYIFTALLGSWFIAKSFQIINEDGAYLKIKKYITAVSVLLIILLYSFHLYSRMYPLSFHHDPAVAKMGYKLQEIVKPQDLVIVRSVAEERERGEWGDRINNFEDPRMFYIADVRGWPLPSDSKGYNLIKKYTESGADYFVEPFSRNDDEELYNWLENNGELIFEEDYGRIFKLNHSK